MVSSFAGNTRTLFEIQNQKDYYQWLLTKIVNKIPISTDLIKSIHFELTKGTYDERRYLINQERPGEFKKHDDEVGVLGVGSSVDEVENELEDLISEIYEIETNGLTKGKIFTIAAYFHARFENIHPFSDGNGRVGRTLINYYLLTHNQYPIIIFNEDKKLYYECLETYDKTDDINPLKEFLLYEQEKYWNKQKKDTKKSLAEYL